MISLTINGKQIEAQEGMTVLRAAQQAGIPIPNLCDHPQLTPYGGCRLCVVEVKGMRVPMAACTMPVAANMVVETDTPALRQSRQVILSLLFSERNHFCPFCQVSGGDCELQNAAYVEEMTHWPMQPQWNNFVVDTSHPYFVLDNNRCILCRRCVRACAEMSGNFTLSVEERGAASVIVADYNVPLGQSTCISCGSCVQVCPTGALIDRRSAYLGLNDRLTEVNSICTQCSVGCGIKIFTRENHLVRIEGDWAAGVNGGTICKVGRFQPLEEKRHRITQPQIRKNGALVPVSWEEALSEAANHLQSQANKVETGVAALASTRLPVESLTAFKSLFAGGLHSKQVTGIEEGLTTALQADLADRAGTPIEGKLDLLRSADCVLVVGANLIHSHEVVGFMIKRSLPKGVNLIVVDPHDSGLNDLANITLQAQRGTDADVLRALEAVIVKEKLNRTKAPWMDVDLVLEEALRNCGLLYEDIKDAAMMLTSALAPVIIYGKGLSAHSDLESLADLNWLARLIGGSDSERIAVLSVKGEANSLAASQLHLDAAFQLDGCQVAYIALGDHDAPPRLVERARRAPYLIIQASYISELTECADIVLPVTNWAEQGGHYLNLDGRLQLSNSCLQPPTSVRENTEVLVELANHLGVELDLDWRSALVERTPINTLSGF